MKSTPGPKVSTGRKIYRFTIVFTLLYCSVGIALYHLQEKLLFHPKALPHDFQFKFDIPFKEVNIPMNETDTLNLIRFFPSDSMPKGVVIYFHGNKGNVTRFAKYAANFTKHGFEVWMPDYPTYGKTTGKLAEENMYNQATEVYKLAHSKFSADSIIVYGKSLGSGVASHIAANHDCARLILETPFYSIPDLFSHYAPIYPVNRMTHFKFPVGENLKEVKAPVIIFHGTNDDVIPYDAASKLKRVLKPGDEFITIENGTHNNLNDSPLFHSELDSVLSL
jgi:alpha-beta hydrolase superfamily lysophospholipase